MHKYNELKIKDITFDSKQWIDNSKLQVLTSLYRIQTDWLITSLNFSRGLGEIARVSTYRTQQE